MIYIAAAWWRKPSVSKLQYGDISRVGGLPFSKAAGHGTHKVGMAFDMRILRKDKALMGMEISSEPKKNTQYDIEATREFIRLCRSLYPETTIYFNDPVIRGEDEFKNIVQYSDDHWDHMHVMPFVGGREGK